MTVNSSRQRQRTSKMATALALSIAVAGLPLWFPNQVTQAAPESQQGFVQPTVSIAMNGAGL